VAPKRIYVRDREGKFAETGTLNKKLKGVARELSMTSNTSLAQRVTFRTHGITNPAHQQKVVGHVRAMTTRARRLRQGQLPVKVTNGKRSYRKGN
jgi:hypothetical protein